MNKYQAGMSPVGVLVTISLVALILVVGLKVAPHYMDYLTLKKIYQDVNTSEEVDEMSPQQIFTAIEKRIMLNAINDFKTRENTLLNKETGNMRVGLDYEVQEHLFGNVSVLLNFEYMPE